MGRRARHRISSAQVQPGSGGDHQARVRVSDEVWRDFKAATAGESISRALGALVELAPQDKARIEKTAAQLLAEAGRDSAAFQGRSARSLQRAGGKLVAWGADAPHTAVLRRLQAQLDTVCAKVAAADGQRAACSAMLRPAGKKAA